MSSPKRHTTPQNRQQRRTRCSLRRSYRRVCSALGSLVAVKLNQWTGRRVSVGGRYLRLPIYSSHMEGGGRTDG